MERDLTAFENIFLFGVIMGLRKKEIKMRLDDIVSFAEIEDLLFCPLRDFSFGMIQRLALSISRYVSSDILLLDEMFYLADIGFREKYYSVFDNYVSSSKTVIVTSQDIEIIKRFCNKCLLLDKGNQVSFGPTEEILNIYLKKQ